MSDLVIGTRRGTGRARSIVTLVALIGVAVLVSIFVFRGMVAYPHPDPKIERTPLAYRDRALATAGGHLEHLGRVPVVTLTGSPAQTGFAHGRLLREAVHRRLEQGHRIIAHTTANDGWLRSVFADQSLRWRYRHLDDGIPGHALVELAALARGAAVEDSYETLVRNQATPDIGRALPTSAAFDLHSLQRTLSVVAPLRGPQGDRLTISRLVATAGGTGPRPQATVFVVHGEGALPFVSIGEPGQIGVTTGVNSASVAITVHPGRTADVDISNRGVPATLLARSVLSTAKNLDEAIHALKTTAILGSASFLVVDGKSRQHAVVERSPRHSHVDSKMIVVDGVLRGKPFADDPENDRARRADVVDTRRARAKSLVRKIADGGVDALAALLRDRRSSDQTLLPAGHRGTIDDPLADAAVILDPSAMVLWVAEGAGTTGPMRALDLRYRLGISSRAAAPPDIAAAPASEQGETWKVVTARTHLERALLSAQEGNRQSASESAEAAVTLAPTWPLARRVAGKLAHRAGFKQRAVEHYQQFMQAADSPWALEQIQAVLSSLR